MKILNLVDHLLHGGVQRMAVNIANELPKYEIESHLSTILQDGELRPLVQDTVHYFSLSADKIFSPLAVRKLHAYCKENKIEVIHAHHKALYLASQVSFIDKNIKLVWHDHYGRQQYRQRPWLLYYFLTRPVDRVISVSRSLQNWAIESMKIPKENVKFIPNFIDFSEEIEELELSLPGKPGKRIVCVANFRPHKDHFTLLKGFKNLSLTHPDAHLILVGQVEDQEYYERVEEEIQQLHLENHVTNLGKRMDVHAILRSSDIGLLSSASEGLPLVLIEYGHARLPVLCTDVGDCSWIIEDKKRGIIIPPGKPDDLSSGLVTLLDDPQQAQYYANNLKAFVDRHLNKKAVVEKVIDLYKSCL